MSLHLDREIEYLKRDVSRLGVIVVENLHRAIRSVLEGNEELAKAAIALDSEIDELELKIEENVLKLLALHQPVAFNLRYLVTVMKVSGELEAIGGQVENIAQRALGLLELRRLDMPYDFGAMAEKVSHMMSSSLDAMIQMDHSEALKIMDADEEVDAMHAKVYGIVKDAIRQHPERLDALIHDLSISRHLERIADHAEAIAEDTIYMIDGTIIRHRHKKH
jgi:phosphate transport system protein